MDLGELIQLSWENLDGFREIAESRAARASPPDDEEEEEHRCAGYACPHVVADESGSYVCRLTGRTFGHQMMNGPIDNRLWEAPAYFPGKRKRVARAIMPFEEVFSSCANVVNKLLDTMQRRQADADRVQKALKSAARRATSLCSTTPCALTLMYKLFAEVERSGALVVSRTVSEDRKSRIVHILTQVYQVVLAPYTRVDKRRPSNAYYALAMCYLLSTQALGARLHVPLLAAFLPEEKSLKHMDFSVTRMTSAKRYILAAIKHYVSLRG
jgi:hypothetical protein